MRYTILAIFICLLFYGCSDYDDSNEDNVTTVLYDGYDQRLLNYNTVTEQNKQMVWHEEFDNNDSKWPFDISKAHEIYDEYYPQYHTTATIEDGCLQVTSTMPFTMNSFFEIPVVFHEDRNYEIELSIFDNSVYSYLISLSFDHDGIEENANLVKTVEEGEEKIQLCGSNRIVSGWIYSKQAKDFLSPNQFNIITVRKINNMYSFYIGSAEKLKSDLIAKLVQNRV